MCCHHNPPRVELPNDVERLVERRLDLEHRMVRRHVALAGQRIELGKPFRHNREINALRFLRRIRSS